MNTEPATPTSAIDYIQRSITKHKGDFSPGASCDHTHTSDRAVLLSRNLGSLREQLSPRPDVLQKFSAMTDSSIRIDDKTLDSLLGKMGFEVPGS